MSCQDLGNSSSFIINKKKIQLRQIIGNFRLTSYQYHFFLWLLIQLLLDHFYIIWFFVLWRAHTISLFVYNTRRQVLIG
jgi:hypothetical protein